MKEHKVNISSHSIVSSGLPQERKFAVSEYIWNGFDAGASKVYIQFKPNELGHIPEFSIIDNGTGIDYDRLKYTFGSFLDSPKRNLSPRSSYVRGKKGKGRFSFTVYAENAHWHSCYNKGGKNYAFDLYVEKNSSQKFKTNNHLIVLEGTTGTKVTFSGLYNITGNLFTSLDFEKFLAQEFGWFLYLNRKADFALFINDKKIDYTDLIATSKNKKLTFKTEEGKEEVFNITFIRWKKNIGDKCYYYYLDHQQREIAKELTSFNNNPVGFYHSLFIKSHYFNDFVLNDFDISKSLFGRNRHDGVYKQLIKSLNTMVGDYMSDYISDAKVEKLMSKLHNEGCFSILPNDDAVVSKKLNQLVRKMYCIDPRLFERLKKEQAQLLISSLYMLIELADKEKIVSLIDKISPLGEKQKKQFKAILK